MTRSSSYLSAAPEKPGERRFESERDYYEITWAAGQRSFDPYSSSPELVRILKTLHRQGSSLLDIGCGAGKYAVEAARLGYRSIGVDFSHAALRLAISYARSAGLDRQVQFVCADALNITLGRKFDVIIDCGCFHHIRKADWRSYFARICCHLASSGYFVLRVFSKRSSFADWVPTVRNRHWSVWRGHYTHFFTKRELLRTVLPFFEVISVEEVAIAPTSWRFVLILRPAT